MPWIFPYRGRNVAVSCFMPTGGLELGWANSWLYCVWQPCQRKPEEELEKVKSDDSVDEEKDQVGLALSFLTLRYFGAFSVIVNLRLVCLWTRSDWEGVRTYPWSSGQHKVYRDETRGLSRPVAWVCSLLSPASPPGKMRCSNQQRWCLKHLLLTSDKLLSHI